GPRASQRPRDQVGHDRDQHAVHGLPGDPVRRLQAVGLRPRARARDARALPRDEERHRLDGRTPDQPVRAVVRLFERLDALYEIGGGLEAVERIGQQERTLCVVAFRDEEGWRFGRGCFGSRALCGQLEAGELTTLDDEGVALADAVGRDLPERGWLEPPPAAYVEVHIE